MKDWLRSKLKNFLYPEPMETEASGVLISSRDDSPEIGRHSIRFNVMPARGGTIVQLHQYDRRTDDTTTLTYVISDGEDVATRVAEIVSMEMLRLN